MLHFADGSYGFGELATETARLPGGVYIAQPSLKNGLVFRPSSLTNETPLGLGGVAEEVISEVKTFLKSAETYQKFGFAHKRGYLFHGPPGCGKSTLLRKLEQDFITEFDGIVILGGINNPHAIPGFQSLRAAREKRPIMIVWEDLDGRIDVFEHAVLEFLDGQAKLNNFVLVATTNNLNMVPARIRNRPSRIDRVVKVDYPVEEARFAYLQNLGVEVTLAKQITDVTDKLSMAHLKEIVIGTACLRQPLGDVVKRVRELAKSERE